MSIDYALPVLPFRQITDSEAIDYMMRLDDSYQRQVELYYERKYLAMMAEQGEIALFVSDFKESHDLLEST